MIAGILFQLAVATATPESGAGIPMLAINSKTYDYQYIRVDDVGRLLYVCEPGDCPNKWCKFMGRYFDWSREKNRLKAICECDATARRRE